MEVKNPGTDAHRNVRDRDVLWQATGTHAAVPATAILHLHDREWVYTPLGPGISSVWKSHGKHASRQHAGDCLGIKPGDQVVSNALPLQNTVEQ